MKHIMLLLAPLALSACVTSGPPDASGPPIATTRIGEPVRVDGLRIIPLAVLEDSRCPVDVQCIQAGTVRIDTRIRREGSVEVRPMELRKPIQVFGREIVLAEVRPERRSDREIAPGDYRFTFEVRP
jgi:hypothetical protein